MKGIDRFFGITKALSQVDFRIYKGEVIGLVGPNGAGKSTLIKVLTGVLPPTSGHIFSNGVQMSRYTAKEAKDSGISCAYQDMSLCTNLAVYENFAILNMSRNLLGKVGWRRQKRKETSDLLERFFPGSSIDVTKSVGILALADRQIVENCKAFVAEGLKVLILDEPTSALSTDRAMQLHKVVRELRACGAAVIYISHKLDEIKMVSDRIILMRNGRVEGEFNANDTTKDELVHLMGGEVTRRVVEEKMKKSGQRVVDIKGLSNRTLSNVNMYVEGGEIVGVSGLAGSGQKEILSAIFDAGTQRMSRRNRNSVSVFGSVSYISGDRTGEGIFHLWSIFDNILITSLDRVKNSFLIARKRSETLVQHWYDKLKFKAEGIHSPIASLSGGNQQKALLARGIASGANLILLNDPTAGVDVGTKQEIYELLRNAKAEGKSMILYSTEDAEMEICDRAYVMRGGMVVAHLSEEEITAANIVHASFEDTDGKVKSSTSEKNRREGILSSRAALPVATMLLMILANVYLNPKILSYVSIRMLVGTAVPLVFASLGQMFIVLAGDIDMGNGYSIGLVNVLVAVVLTENPLFGVISIAVFISAYIFMGALIHLRKIPAIVVTLGAQFIWLGVALIFSPTPGGHCPEWLAAFYRQRISFVPMPVILCLLAALSCYYLLYRSQYGMILRGIGNNPEAVERSGWSHLAAKMTNYGLSALMVVLAGTTFTAVCLSADANSAASYCMMSIATIILGGCEMSGGIVEPVGVVAGAIAMSFITTLLAFLKVASNYQTAVMGLILILVLTVKLVTTRWRVVA
ncbi:MAG: ATP-binding cassette domain-containing protein [Synergistaceae bacterium]|nr:ATP-binding cassette domain-containing protein [Synergistaceae bacterium]